jgi:hypothetical protein
MAIAIVIAGLGFTRPAFRITSPPTVSREHQKAELLGVALYPWQQKRFI